MSIQAPDLGALLAWAHDYILAHPHPDFVIGPPDDPQLQRWYIIPRNPFSNVYLHRFLRSDDNDAPHDHPWDSWSLLLEGEYLEETTQLEGSLTEWIRADGRQHYRTAYFAHRILLPTTNPAITLFLTGTVFREWGFHTAEGWVPHQEYLETTPQRNQRRYRNE